MKIILAGIIGRYPYGGVAWCSLMYLLGLRELGHEVWYLEDTGECNYDPTENTMATEPTYALDFIRATLTPYEFGERWCYVDYNGRHHGQTRDSWLKVCANADLFINLSGGCWFWRDEYASIPHSAFIDTDPAFTQLSIAKGVPWYVDFFGRHKALFTFGSNIGTINCTVPTDPFEWHSTWQPISPQEWKPTGEEPRDCFTTVMTWKIKSFEDIGGNKDQEFLNVLDLPKQTSVPLELAVNGPHDFLRAHGWSCRNAFDVSSGLDVYRDYISTSRGEFSVAKHTYVASNSGWFSDRSGCYLMSGRPIIVQDTGFSQHLPTGTGLLTFRNSQQALAGLDSLCSGYEKHAKAARELARAYFAPDVVLQPLLERATA